MSLIARLLSEGDRDRLGGLQGGLLVRRAVRHSAAEHQWVDTVEVGANVLVDDDPAALTRAVGQAAMPAERPELYGDGRASDRIADLLGTLFPS